jgi:hypothetical protein
VSEPKGGQHGDEKEIEMPVSEVQSAR